MSVLRRTGVVASWAVAVLVLAVIVFLAWTQTVFQGERDVALEVWEDTGITVTSGDDAVVLSPSAGATGEGLVFVPGARVDPYAYMGKLSGLVADGMTVVITKPVLNLALLDTRPLSAFTDAVPGVDTWYVGGHSLGGVRACMMADEAAGLILFGSYCATDVDVPVLSISGSDDGLSTPEKIADAAARLPDDATFVEIEGADHASFGDYGAQPGDGEQTTSDAEVRAAIAEAVAAFVSAG